MSDDAPAATEIVDQETTIPNTSPTDVTNEVTTPEFQSIVPQEYADKAWVQDVKDIDGFFKMANDMKSELGRRAEAAAPTAPDNVDAYQLSDPVDKDFQDAVKDLFLKNNVPVEMAKGLDADWAELVSKFAPNAEESDAEFSKMTDELFGSRADEAVQIAKGLLVEHTPEAFKDQVNGLDNKNLTIMAAVLDSIQAKYINEDDLPKGGDTVPGGISDIEKRAEAKRLMASPEFKSKSHPGHAEVAAKIDKLYQGIA